MTQCGDSHGAGRSLAYCRPPPLAHVGLARSVGLIASEVNKIGDKNQFQKRDWDPGGCSEMKWSPKKAVCVCECVCV